MSEIQLSIRQALGVLRVREDATPDEITQAWRAMMRAVHPDRNPNPPDVARRQFDTVQAAYQRLNEPEVMALRKAAFARGPAAPFVPGELEAFRILGLGPSASYREIDAKLEELLAAGDAKGDYKRAADVLRGPHVRALAALRQDAGQESYSSPLRPAEFQPRATPVPKRRPPVKAILLAVVGLLFVVAGIVLLSKHDALLAIGAAILALAAFAGSASARGMF